MHTNTGRQTRQKLREPLQRAQRLYLLFYLLLPLQRAQRLYLLFYYFWKSSKDKAVLHATPLPEKQNTTPARSNMGHTHLVIWNKAAREQ
jgi:hypothetical protein